MYFDSYSSLPSTTIYGDRMYKPYRNTFIKADPIEEDRLALAEFLGLPKISSWEHLIEHIVRLGRWQEVLEWRIAS